MNLTFLLFHGYGNTMKLNLDNLHIKKELCKGGYSLYPHQKGGVKWLLKTERTYRGGLLADEMGLGKTIQIISMMIANPLPITLIVCPASLKPQWSVEINKFAPSIVVNPELKELDLEKQNVFIISYNKLNRHSIFRLIEYNRLICDEVHYVRNSRSKTFENLYKIKSNIHWAITGTPIQNYKKDIMSIFKFLRKDSTNVEILLKKYMLRRTYLELDFKLPKISHSMKFVGSFNTKFMSMIENNDYMFHLEKILRLKQACIIPSQTLKSIRKKYDTKDTNYSLQLAKLNTIIDDVLETPQNKTIIFSYFRQEIQYLYKRLSPNINVAYIDGGTSPKRKIANIDNLDLNVLIIQINAGGTGLNLQHYNNIIINGPQWNPTLEQQAIARAYRIGQTKDVGVKRYIVGQMDEYSIEKKILQIQRDKLKLIKKYIP